MGKILNVLKSIFTSGADINRDLRETERRIRETDRKLKEMEDIIAQLKIRNEYKKTRCVACYKRAFKGFEKNESGLKVIEKK